MSPFLGDLFGALDGLEIGTDDVTELGFCDQKVIVITLGALDGLLIIKYVGTELVSLEGSTGGTSDGKFEGPWLGA